HLGAADGGEKPELGGAEGPSAAQDRLSRAHVLSARPHELPGVHRARNQERRPVLLDLLLRDHAVGPVREGGARAEAKGLPRAHAAGFPPALDRGGGLRPPSEPPPKRRASRRTATGWAPCVRGEQSGRCAGEAGARTASITLNVFTITVRRAVTRADCR